MAKYNVYFSIFIVKFVDARDRLQQKYVSGITSIILKIAMPSYTFIYIIMML